ncbi:inositol monophosphatase family protein [Pseudaestuariivita atlantica]|uniref:Inositol-1-monophosphatase n=1 Tax=Pseudaestuariivita atlantica TaxID=1317121 RepID=A0A0L1JQA9_9RHOB|nr:inositol monophosphatase family protein [Pseudaestuariivita atlantica]KNG93944.1 inositol monophosphatase [Pseudaestuariivita atlantica]
MVEDVSSRKAFAEEVCHAAGERALAYFRDRENLKVDSKGAQDWVSEADKAVEVFIRDEISAAWPEDGVFGEEHGARSGTSGFDWVIDPIDGTTNFVNGIPAWTIVLAGVTGGTTRIGVIRDPNVDETYAAERGAGATLNGKALSVAAGVPLDAGTVSVGYSNRVEAAHILPVIADLIERGAMYHRNASGALSLAYVAAGRLLGYVEEHMNAWDCLAGQLMIAEAGGRVEDQDAQEMIRRGGRVVVGTPDVFPELVGICDRAWGG